MARIALVGTAQSWVSTPWTDASLKIVSVNDAYRMKGFVRADAWYDLHPLDHMLFHDGRAIYAHQVPGGFYVRPTGHLDWLASQQIPIYLHPDWKTQRPTDASAQAGFDALLQRPNVHAFPKEAIQQAYGRYFTSSPGWIVAQLLLDGCRELHVYGIHLATEHEYIEQRPNFEFLCGSLLGPGARTMTVTNGMRRYESESGILILPEASPVLQSAFQYAFEPRPASYLEPIKWEAHKVGVKHARALRDLRTAPWYRSTRQTKRELCRLEAWQADVQDQLNRVAIAERWR